MMSDSINPLRVTKLLKKLVVERRGIRWHLSVKCRFVKYDSNGEEIYAEPYFTSRVFQITNAEEDMTATIEEAIGKISNDIETYIRCGSGWVFINVVQYKPLKGNSYIPRPMGLRGYHHGIVNIQNRDQNVLYIVCSTVKTRNAYTLLVGRVVASL